MKALIILAHGSRRKESNEEIKDLANKVKKIADNEYQSIKYAYLEAAEPTLLQSIEGIVEKGITEITVLPYFLNSGNHVKQDIPAIIEMAIKNHPNCRFRVSACIGMTENMPSLILQQARLT